MRETTKGSGRSWSAARARGGETAVGGATGVAGAGAAARRLDDVELGRRADDLVSPLVRGRWSPRGFEDRPVDAERVRSLLEAARWAASSYNEQPWAFLVATREEPEAYAALLSTLNERNRKWARTAPVLMISLAKLRYDRTGRENRHAWHDVGLATGQLMLQAVALGLAVHPMGGFDPEAVLETGAVPEGWEPVAALAIGYPAAAPPRERTRKELHEFTHAGRWGETPHFVTME